MSAATGPYWVGIIQDDDDSSTRPAELFEGSEEQMRTFIKSRYKRQLGDTVGDIEDDDFAPREWGFAVFDLTKYTHLYIYGFERKYTSAAVGGKRRKRSTRRRRSV
jgi:hypothetical protein